VPETTEPATTEPATTEPATTEPATTVPADNAFQIIETGSPRFAEAIVAAEMQTVVEGGQFTVFAPDDAALQGLSDEIFSDQTLAAQFVNGYVVDGALDLAALQQQGQVTTLGGQTLMFNDTQVSFETATATIVTPDQQASNGFVHGLDAVLFVPAATPTTPPAGTQPAVPTGS
jgi:uncharacterized surface protein with fasciclin (FAS1) repeats